MSFMKQYESMSKLELLRELRHQQNTPAAGEVWVDAAKNEIAFFEVGEDGETFVNLTDYGWGKNTLVAFKRYFDLSLPSSEAPSLADPAALPLIKCSLPVNAGVRSTDVGFTLEDGFVNRRKFAKLMGCTPGAVTAKFNKGNLAAVKIGHNLLVAKTELMGVKRAAVEEVSHRQYMNQAEFARFLDISASEVSRMCVAEVGDILRSPVSNKINVMVTARAMLLTRVYPSPPKPSYDRHVAKKAAGWMPLAEYCHKFRVGRSKAYTSMAKGLLVYRKAANGLREVKLDK